MRAFTIPSIFTAVDRFTGPVGRMSNNAAAFAARTERSFQRAGASAFALARKAAMVGAAVVIPLGVMVKAAVNFEDKMTDVAKTTGLNGQALKDFGEDLLRVSKDTRTTINDLATVAEIGGQLGIPEKQLLSFVDSANKFNVALGKDFSGGVEEAVSQVGKIKELFKETSGTGMSISDAIMKTGSAINDLGAMGAGTSSNITDFTLRLGALPAALKPSLQNTLALGTHFEELGIDSQIAAGGLTNFLLVAGKHIGGFANQMGVSADQAKKLLASDPTEFAKKFALSLKGMAPEKLAAKLEALHVGSQETIKVIGALGSNVEKLDKLQQASARSFAAGTSLQDEYNKKNATAAAKFAKLKNSLSAVAITLGNALLPVIINLVESVTPFIEKISRWVSDNKELATTVVKAALAFGGFAFAVSAISFAVGVYKKAVVLAAAAQEGWNLVMSMNPIGAVITGVLALSAAIYAVVDAYSAQSIEQIANEKIIDRVIESTADQRSELLLLFEQLKRSTKGSKEFQGALTEIDRIQPGIVRKYNLQEKSLNNMNKAYSEMIFNIEKVAKAEAAKGLLTETYKKIAQFEAEKMKPLKGGLFDREIDKSEKGYAFAKKAFDDLMDQNIADLKREAKIYSDLAFQDENKPYIDPNKPQGFGMSVQDMLNKAGINTKVDITLNGVPQGSTATAKASSGFVGPLLTSTR